MEKEDDIFSLIDKKLSDSGFCIKNNGRLFSLDRIFLHKFYGIPIFCLIVFCFFILSFNCGQKMCRFINFIFSILSSSFSNIIPDCFFRDMLLNCIFPSLTSIFECTALIFFFFFYLSMLEDSGYLIRGAFLVDKLMKKVGLSGNCLMPLISSFGCNIPGILSARTINGKYKRIITILISLMMSCPAKIPVYILLSGLFFSGLKQSVFILFIYIFGIIVACFYSKVLSACLKDGTYHFVAEIPEYKLPNIKTAFTLSLSKVKYFILKTGPIILFFNILIWFLISPKKNLHDEKSHDIENSYVCKLGKKMESVTSVLGFDWRMNVSILAGICSKESIPSVLELLYGNHDNLKTAITFSKMMSFVVFILFYCPCVGSIATIFSEIGVFFSILCLFLNTIIAFLFSFLFFRIFMFL